jgi:hypothetical protein
MTDDERRETLRHAAMEESARKSRRALCRALAAAFEHTGMLLRTSGHLFGPQRVDGTSPFGNGDDGLVALGYLGETAAALISGGVELIERDNPYAVAALNRQLVEVEYLTWAFAEDDEEASSWLRATRSERLQRWQPRHLYYHSQGRFRGRDYQEHCEVGGHPTPLGMRTVFGPGANTSAEIILYETANHGLSAWSYLLTAISARCQSDGSDMARLVPQELADALRVEQGRWRETDRLPAAWRTPSANSASDH